MKICIINSAYPKCNNLVSTPNELKSNQKPHSICNKEIHNEIPYYITFKSSRKKDIDDLYRSGYEDIKLTPDNQIENTSKFLVVNSLEDFLAISKTPRVFNNYFALNADIDLENVDYTPIGNAYTPFTGVFNGNEHTIKNLSMKSYEGSTKGLFGQTYNARISNLNLENFLINGENELGCASGHSVGTNFSKIQAQGKINGEIGIGGIIGISECNNIDNVKFSGDIAREYIPQAKSLFDFYSENDKSIISGGIIGMDEGSSLNCVYCNANIYSNYQGGGIIGSTSPRIQTNVSNCCFEGIMQGTECLGGIIGNSINTKLQNCISLEVPILGVDSNSILRGCIDNIEVIKDMTWQNIDSGFWVVNKQRLPRIKEELKNKNAIKIFLEDVNMAREIGLIEDTSTEFESIDFIDVPIEIEEPRKYPQNKELVEKIKNSKNSVWLHSMFGKYTDSGTFGGIDCRYTDEYDEILLELVKNKHLPVNRTFQSMSVGESWGCTPFYVTSRLGKAAIFEEMLKRDDIDPYKKSGALGAEVDTVEMMLKYPNDTSAYLLYTSKNPIISVYLEKSLEKFGKSVRKSDSILLKALNRAYKDKVELEFDAKKGVLKVPREYIEEQIDDAVENEMRLKYDANNKTMLTLNDCLRNMALALNFKDSQGNNLINVIPEMENEFMAYTRYLQAKKLDVDINNPNSFDIKPVDNLLQTKQNQEILSDICYTLNDYSTTNSYGETALHVFCQNSDQDRGIKYLLKAVSRGASLNVQDNNGTTLLMKAIEKKYFNMANFLLYYQADVNTCDSNGQNALHIACENCESFEDLKFVSLLMTQNINPFVKDISGRTPFDYLSDEFKTIALMNEEEFTEFVKEIGMTALPFAPIMYNERCNILESSNIVEADCNIYMNKNLNKKPYFIKIKDLFDKIDKVSYEEKTLLLQSLLKTLSLEEYNVSKIKNRNVLHKLARVPHPIAKECINKICLLDTNIINELNEHQETALMSAIDAYMCAENDREKLCILDNIKVLQDKNADVHLLDENNMNVLHRICFSDCVILLAKFLDLNVNINQKDKFGKNPIEYLSPKLSNKMRTFFETYAIKKKLTVLIKNI